MTTIDRSLLTEAALVAAFRGDEKDGAALLQSAAAQLEQIRVNAAVTMCAGFGKSEAETRAFLVASGITEAPPPAKRTRTVKTMPEAPPDNAAFLLLLLSALDAGRATAKGLAGKFRGGDKDLVSRLLSEEASRGTAARVRLEPNGRTWVKA